MNKHSNSKIKILSIGINNYKSESISNLSGCVSDAEKLRGFFLNTVQIPAQDYHFLCNEVATRDSIINAFRSHFRSLNDGDVALFHYSGHGSWEETSTEFVKAGLEPAGGRNEVLVCHDSEEGHVSNIADKELRLLISELQRDDNSQKLKDILFIGLFDCCHSGSILRKGKSNYKNRLHLGKSAPRLIDEYLEGQYKEQKRLKLAAVNYMSFTACSPRESALEDNNGGIFTNTLLNVLAEHEKTGRYPSYAQLFTAVRHYVKKITKRQQTPYFEYVGRVNPHQSFLGLPSSSEHKYSQLVKEDEDWKVNIGAIHGITFDMVREQQIAIYEDGRFDDPIGICRVLRVELEYTCLGEIAWDDRYQKLNELTGAEWQAQTTNLVVALMPVAFPVGLEVDVELNSMDSKLLRNLKENPFYEISDHANYIIHLKENSIAVCDTNGKLITGIRRNLFNTESYIMKVLNKINTWSILSTLIHPKHAQISADKIAFSFQYTDYDNNTHVWENTDAESDQNIIELSFDTQKGAIPYSITVENKNGMPMYFYLVHLDRKFGVSQKNESYLKFVYFRETQLLYDSNSWGLGLGITDEKIQTADDTFIIIGTTTALHAPYAFDQKGLGNLFGRIGKKNDFLQKEENSGHKRETMRIKKQSPVNWVFQKLIVRLTQNVNA